MIQDPAQELETLILERDEIAQKIETISNEDDVVTRQVAAKSAKSYDTRPNELDQLRQLLQQIEDRIQALRTEDRPDNGPDTPDPPPIQHDIIELTQRHGAQIAIARTSQPWLLPVNTLVIPVGVKGGMQGGLSQAMRDALGESVWQDLRSHIQSQISAIDPKTPQLITLPPELGKTILPQAPAMEDGTIRYQIIAATPATVNSDDLDPGGAAQAIVALALENNIDLLAMPLLGSGRAQLESVFAAEEMFKAIYTAIPENNQTLRRLILTTHPTADDDKSNVVTALRNLCAMFSANLSQPLGADTVEGEDTLGIKTEVYALAETLLLRNVETPLAVGILGGWGSGKSFVMHLMQKEMRRIRSLEVSNGWQADDSEFYVGHIYPIEFNAWTYAKSDLWASLMQTIFMELNRQLSLEQLFTKEQLLKGGANWLELNQLGEKERLALLETEVGKDTVAAWRRGETPDSLWEAYHQMRATEIKAMVSAVETRAEKEEALTSLQKSYQTAQEEIPQAARQAVWKEILETAVFSPIATEIQNTLRDQTYTTADGKVVHIFSDEDLEDLTKLSIKLKQFRPTMTGMWQWDNVKKSLLERKWVLGTAVLLILASIGAAWLSEQLTQFAQSATVVSITTFLASFGSIAAAAFRTYQEWMDEIQRWAGGIQDVHTLAAEMLQSKESQITTAVAKDFSQQKEALEQEIAALTAQIDDHRQRMGIAGQFTSLFDFVLARLGTGDYEKRLGALHQTQADLQELTDTLTVNGEEDLHAAAKQAFFPRGPARVVLFIDDLDRCPPPKVVEVLEAVQLLLRTKLFVIVLGLDTRYVTRALEKEYDRILTRDGDPSGLDYIEKIIQIPYRVRPIEPANLPSFLASQMVMIEEEGTGQTAVTTGQPTPTASTNDYAGSDNSGYTPITTPTGETPRALETIQPQVIKFHPDDFADLMHACTVIGLTPRSIKRLINVLKLIKVFWFRTNQYKKPHQVRTVISLLALSARYPEIMAQTFANIEAAFRNGTQEALSAFLTRPSTDLRQHDSFETAVITLELAEITLAELGLETFHLVRSFSFVGDPSYNQ